MCNLEHSSSYDSQILSQILRAAVASQEGPTLTSPFTPPENTNDRKPLPEMAQ